MQTKLIRGPWAIFHDHPDAETAKSVATIRPVGTKRGEDEVCNVFLCDYPGETGERARATARLISAAPELLEVAQALVAWCDKNQPAGEALYFVQQARAAVAKAIEYTPAQEAA